MILPEPATRDDYRRIAKRLQTNMKLVQSYDACFVVEAIADLPKKIDHDRLYRIIIRIRHNLAGRILARSNRLAFVEGRANALRAYNLILRWTPKHVEQLAKIVERHNTKTVLNLNTPTN